MNPHIRSQSPLCYPYTIPLDTFVIIPAFADLSREKRNIFAGSNGEDRQRFELFRASSLRCLRRILR